MSPSLCLEGLSSSSTNSCEAQECQDAYSATVSHQKKLLSLRIMEYQFSKRLTSSSGDKVWNHLEILEILLWWKWLDLLLHWVYKATFWSLWWTARTTSLSSSHVPAPHSSSQFQWTQGTAEPCSQSGGISWKTYLRNYKKCCTTVEREEWEICEKALKVPRSEKEGTRCSRHWKRDSPTAHAGAGLSWQNCGPRTTHVEAVCEGLYPIGRTQPGVLEECDKKKVAERSCYRLIPAAISCILTPLRERSQDWRTEVEPEKKKEGEGKAI